MKLEKARNRKNVAAYVCQVVSGSDDDSKSFPIALEVARGDLKTSRHHGQRTPVQLLSDLQERRARQGEWTDADSALDERDLKLWREYEKAMKGVPAIRWSKGLRKDVGMAAQEKTDAEIVAEEKGGVDAFTFLDDSYKAVSATFRGARAQVLRTMETEGKKRWHGWSKKPCDRGWHAGHATANTGRSHRASS